MNWQEYRFPYLVHDGACYGAKWVGDRLSMTVCRYYMENEPNEIEVEFDGVEWIRSTCGEDEKYYMYDPTIPMEDYPLINQAGFQKDYKEFVAYGNLNDIRYLDRDIVFIEDIMIIKCREMHIIRAVCNPDIDSTIDKLM